MARVQPLIFIVGDFGAGDLAFAEIKRKIKNRVRDADIDYVTVQSYSTISTGFCIYQLALDHDGSGENGRTYIFSNTAPRRDNPNPRKQNEGEGLVYAKLKTGLEVIAVLSGCTFSFIKPMIKELRRINVDNKGSQFRSRDKYPEPLARIMNKDYSVLGEELEIGKISDPPIGRIAYVDGYGNIKLTTRVSDLRLTHGEKVRVEIGSKALFGFYVDGMFSIKEGDLSVAPGSSGPAENRFIEVSIRLGNAGKAFGSPRVEEKVSIKKVKGI
jgi:S-adenosylmethionine hydrolase